MRPAVCLASVWGLHLSQGRAAGGMMNQEIAQPTKRVRSGRFRWRYLRVVAFFASVALGIIGWDILLRAVGLGRIARRTARARYRRIARRYRRLATRLGGVWIKVGQFLSTRVDMLPEEITSELSGLQDEVSPEPATAMRRVIEAEFGAPVDRVFDAFEDSPLASASLGQVHRARVGEERVVVKVQRPDIHELLEVDLAALRVVVGWLEHYPPVARRADLDALVAEFSRTLWAEVDYIAEAENARRFGKMFESDAGVRVPGVIASHSTRRVLTLEDVYAIKITDYAAIDAAGVRRADVADRLFRTYLRQIFQEGFFHADPHPGNLFVDPNGESGWRLVFVDFGMVGHVSERMRQGLRDMVIGVGVRDMDRLARSYEELGVLLPGADMRRLREAESAVFDRFWGKSMQELTSIDHRALHDMAHEFRDLVFELPFQLPADLIFLGRCVAILSGICTGLHADFNVFEGLTPFAKDLLADEGGDWLNMAFQWLEREGRRMAGLPARIDAALTGLESGKLRVQASPTPELEEQLDHVRRGLHRLAAAVIFASLMLTGAILYGRADERLSVAAWAGALVALGFMLTR
jgi:predicted unusual protein kinase regulating ubiquinone biosynthesis (AarF/ABC1/UbiB family)